MRSFSGSIGRAGAIAGLAFLLSGGCALVIDFGGYERAGGAGGGTGGGAGSTTGAGGSGGQGGCSADLSEDPENCGACGRSCLGGDCVNGSCEAVLLFAAVPGVIYWHLALDGDNVYWTSNGSIESLSKSAPPMTAPTELATDVDADFIAVDDGGVYFSVFGADGDPGPPNFGSIGVVKDGNVLTLAPEIDQPVGLTVWSNTLYWAEYRPTAPIMHQSTIAGSAQELVLNQSLPFFVRADAQGVFWTFRGDGATGGVASNVSGGLFQGGPSPSGLALDAEFVYLLDYAGGVWKVPKGGGEQTELAPAPGVGGIFSGGIAVDDQYVYWTGAGLNSCGSPPCACDSCGAIFRVAKTGGPPLVFAFNSTRWDTATDLVLDDVAVYWTARTPGKLFRKVKPLP
ncbi:MAG: hypothetical protein IT372_30905 [Polyangiaceae bacterium]|nr:hypothetical protein [Polyangiaceae bacterium]